MSGRMHVILRPLLIRIMQRTHRYAQEISKVTFIRQSGSRARSPDDCNGCTRSRSLSHDVSAGSPPSERHAPRRVDGAPESRIKRGQTGFACRLGQMLNDHANGGFPTPGPCPHPPDKIQAARRSLPWPITVPGSQERGGVRLLCING